MKGHPCHAAGRCVLSCKSEERCSLSIHFRCVLVASQASSDSVPQSEPAAPGDFAGWVFEDTSTRLESGKEHYLAQVTVVRTVAAGDAHAGKIGVWFTRIPADGADEDWELLETFQRRFGTGECAWLGSGGDAAAKAMRLYDESEP